MADLYQVSGEVMSGGDLPRSRASAADDFIRSCRPLLLEQFNGVCVVCRFVVDAYDRRLFAELGVEFPPSLSRASDKRCAEFLAGRYAARCAMQYLRIPYSDIPVGADRSPQWPQDISASISHSGDFAVCAMSRDGSPVGVDLEKRPTADTVTEIQQQIIAPVDQQLLQRHFNDYTEGFAVAFSAKESVYKALYPRLQLRFDFLDLDILAVDEEAHWLILAPGRVLRGYFASGSCFAVKWLAMGDFILTYTPKHFEIQPSQAS